MQFQKQLGEQLPPSAWTRLTNRQLIDRSSELMVKGAWQRTDKGRALACVGCAPLSFPKFSDEVHCRQVTAKIVRDPF